MAIKISPYAMSCMNKTLDSWYDSTNSLVDVYTPELRKMAAEARSMLEPIVSESSLRNMSYTTLVEVAIVVFAEDFIEKFEEEK